MILAVPACVFPWHGYQCVALSPLEGAHCISGTNGVHWVAVAGDQSADVATEFMEAVFALEEEAGNPT